MFNKTPRTPFRQDFVNNSGLSIIDTWPTRDMQISGDFPFLISHNIPSSKCIYINIYRYIKT